VTDDCTRALALLAPMVALGYTIAPASTRKHVIVAYRGLGIEFVDVEGLLATDDPQAYCQRSFEGSNA
jgi:hypothetical protein